MAVFHYSAFIHCTDGVGQFAEDLCLLLAVQTVDSEFSPIFDASLWPDLNAWHW